MGNLGGYLIFGALTVAAMVAVTVLSAAHGHFFRPYFGTADPLLMVMLVAALGFVALGVVQSRGWFEIYAPSRVVRGVTTAAGLATVLAVPVIIADIALGFPADINVPLPPALLFYPAMAYVVEVVFHVVPITLFLVVAMGLFRRPESNRLFWFGLVVTALIEPTFQLVMAFSGRTVAELAVCTGVQVLVINLVQVYLFRRFDFVSMLSFRLVYYLYWHIAWGYLRLQL